VSSTLDPADQAVFIEACADLTNHPSADEVEPFDDAAPSAHAVRPAGCRAATDTPIAAARTSPRHPR
jgi:hypothetical protein